MSKRNELKQEYYKTGYYWKDSDGKPSTEYMNWLEDKIIKGNKPTLREGKTITNCKSGTTPKPEIKPMPTLHAPYGSSKCDYGHNDGKGNELNCCIIKN